MVYCGNVKILCGKGVSHTNKHVNLRVVMVRNTLRNMRKILNIQWMLRHVPGPNGYIAMQWDKLIPTQMHVQVVCDFVEMGVMSYWCKEHQKAS